MLTNINIPGYQSICANFSTLAGGVGMHVSNLIDFDIIGQNTIEAGCEDIWICLNNKTSNKKSIIATIYRHPSANAKLFIQALNAGLLKPKLLNSNLFLLGDFNLN